VKGPRYDDVSVIVRSSNGSSSERPGARARVAAAAAFVVAVACGGQARPTVRPTCVAEPPAWLYALRGGKCALGMAGRAPDPDSEAPLQLARTRAAWALAALDGATVVFGVGASARSPRDGDEVFSEQSHVLVARARVEGVAAQAVADVWKDTCGTGPLREPGFSYARLCRVGGRFPTSGPDIVELQASSPPPWIDPNVASGDSDRICVLVRSLPTYDPARHVGVLLEEAANALQRVVEAEVESESVDETTTRDSYVQTEDNSVGTGVVLGAYLSDVWVDHAGRAGRRGTWYARACRARRIGASASTTQPDPMPYP
jgi:hypothetical protein